MHVLSTLEHRPSRQGLSDRDGARAARTPAGDQNCADRKGGQDVIRRITAQSTAHPLRSATPLTGAVKAYKIGSRPKWISATDILPRGSVMLRPRRATLPKYFLGVPSLRKRRLNGQPIKLFCNLTWTVLVNIQHNHFCVLYQLSTISSRRTEHSFPNTLCPNVAQIYIRESMVVRCCVESTLEPYLPRWPDVDACPGSF